MIRRLPPACVLVAALLAGCSSPAAPVSQQRAALAAGQPAPTRTDVLTIAVRLQNEDIPQRCSGSLIDKNLVLTAAHCVSQLSGNGACGSSHVSTVLPASTLRLSSASPAPTTQPELELGVLGVHVPDAANGDLCGNDIALLVLGEPATGSPSAPRFDRPPEVGETVTLTGYGATCAGCAEMRTRHAIDAVPVQCVAEGCAELDPEIRPSEWVAEAVALSGDSGGQARDSEGRVVGVISRGAAGAVYLTRIDSFRDFLVSVASSAAATGGQAPPSWTQAGPDGGTASDAGTGTASDGGCAMVSHAGASHALGPCLVLFLLTALSPLAAGRCSVTSRTPTRRPGSWWSRWRYVRLARRKSKLAAARQPMSGNRGGGAMNGLQAQGWLDGED